MVRSMTEGNPLKLIVAFTVPLLIGNVFQQFYNIADVIIVGRVIGVNALAAVGSTAPIFMALLGMTIGLASGFTVVTAQRFGAGDYDGVRRSVATSASLSFLLIGILIVAAHFLLPQILSLMNVSSMLYDDAFHYISIIAQGLLVMMLYNLLSCICRALGDSRTPLYFLIVSSILNVVLALVFIQHFRWGVPGSAVALVVAQGISAVLCFLYIKKRFPLLRLKREDWRLDREFAWLHLRIGMPMAAQFTIISLGIIVVQSVCNTFGAETIAAFISATRIEQLAMQPMISFGIAIAVFTAQNYGAQKYDRIRQGVRQCSLLLFCLCAVSALAMYLFGRELISLFLTETNDFLLDQASLYLHMSVPCYVFLGQIFVYRNTLQGMGISVVPFASSVLELVLRGAAALILAQIWGYFGICAASPICWVAACFFTTGCYFYFSRSLPVKR
ncbi:MATE family efflux transporter [Megasphaera vaginalis (ex Bordigoni et al. 2020)]|uniref:MATE family efflux transporter n=1 Tax=Megasphaera vaginalis (ex Bordigoni et al. 2020) TaxID=2045301 RepID=UPI000C7A6D94|nr:MATE family efflux transporter [Megasphaera vaginalis (ex Bordigoni et al. 2020)]